MTIVAVLSMGGSFIAWLQAKKEKNAADESAGAAKTYYDLMIVKLNCENEESKRVKQELDILEFISLSDKKVTIDDIIQKLSLEDDKVFECLTYMQRVTRTIFFTHLNMINGKATPNKNTIVQINDNGFIKLQKQGLNN